MQTESREKGRSVCVLGACIAVCRIVYPVMEECTAISDFYEEMSENLLSFFLSEAEARKEEFSHLSRNARKLFPPLRLSHCFAVTFCGDGIISITREYAVSEGKSLLLYRKFGEVWDTELQILVSPQKLFRGKHLRLAKKNEFYLCEDYAVIAENLFPEIAQSHGRRLRLSDHVRETRVEKG